MTNKIININSSRKSTSNEIKVGGKIGQIFKAIGAILPMLILFALFSVGIVKLWQRGIESEVFKIRPSIFITNDEQYSPEALREFDRLSNSFSGTSLLKPGLLDEVKKVYSESPWVEEVCSLQRVYPNRVNIEFIPRFVAAQLKHDGYYWLVAEDGVLLPADGVKKKYDKLPLICGDIEQRPENGQVWHSDGVGGALRALREINHSRFGQEMSISKIEIKSPGFIDKLQRPGRSRPRLTIDTDSKISIMWGTCSENFPGELGYSEKIKLLDGLLSDWKQKGAMGREVCFDVRTNVAGYNL